MSTIFPSARLDEVAETFQGGRHKKSGNDFVSTGGFPAYGAGGHNGNIGFAEFNKPGLVLGMIGTCGKVYRTPERWTSLANTRVIFPDQSRCDLRFLWYQINNQSRWPLSGTSQKFIKPSDADGSIVALPPLPEQRRIADILDRADALRAKRRAVLARLDELTQAIFVEMFGDPVTNPMGWRTFQLSALTREDDSINYGVVQPGEDHEGGVPLVRVGDIRNGRVDHSSLKMISPTIEADYKRSRLRGDEVLLSCVGSVGEVALVRESERGFNIARAVARIPLRPDVDRVFMASFLRSDFAQRYFKNELRTVSQPTLNIKQICETNVPLPPTNLQREFAARIQLVDNIRTKGDLATCSVDALFTALQDRAFRGAL